MGASSRSKPLSSPRPSEVPDSNGTPRHIRRHRAIHVPSGLIVSLCPTPLGSYGEVLLDTYYSSVNVLLKGVLPIYYTPFPDDILPPSIIYAFPACGLQTPKIANGCKSDAGFYYVMWLYSKKCKRPPAANEAQLQTTMFLLGKNVMVPVFRDHQLAKPSRIVQGAGRLYLRVVPKTTLFETRHH
jgi:hypothetical protein